MGIKRLWNGLFGWPEEGKEGGKPGRLTTEELCRRLGMGLEELQRVPIAYREFTVPKRSGGVRRIQAPVDELKAVQRKILRKLLAKLSVHDRVMGFEPGRSIVTNAREHEGRAVVVKMDIRDFFDSTSAVKVKNYFRRIGWDGKAAELLVNLCTHEGGLPQGAPTSPRLSNLVNRRMDATLAKVAGRFKATYTRYADDLTFSLERDDPSVVRELIGIVKWVVRKEGYELHQKRKLQVRRRHHQQRVTGLVVNHRANLPRHRRRWLRAVEHHLAHGKPATLTPQQLNGWKALLHMVDQRGQHPA